MEERARGGCGGGFEEGKKEEGGWEGPYRQLHGRPDGGRGLLHGRPDGGILHAWLPSGGEIDDGGRAEERGGRAVATESGDGIESENEGEGGPIALISAKSHNSLAHPMRLGK